MTTYNQLAGHSVERLAALSDGIFGVAMTLLLLDLHPPLRDAIQHERDLLHALAALGPTVLVYLMSFVTLGIFWVGQQTQLNHLHRSDRHLTWIHLLFLFVVTMMPFTTQLLIAFTSYRSALLVYWFNIFCLGALLYASWRRATRHALVSADLPVPAQAAICRRIVYAQSIYACGAVLCVVSTYLSLAVIVAAQLNYVFAPGHRDAPAPTP